MNEQLTFEFVDRPTIKGYPELRWTGKRPYRSTQYFPAQIRERYGEEQNGWINKIFWGDNLQVMSHLLKNFRGQVDLIYIDPPFDSKAEYKKKISLKNQIVTSDSTSFEEKQYGDIWTNDEYLQFMYERLILMRELLDDNGTIYVHCDWHKNHYLRVVLDEIFGPENFLNEIVWKRSGVHASKKGFGPVHDTILFYKKGQDFTWNPQYVPYEQKYIDSWFNKTDENGRRYGLVVCSAPGDRKGTLAHYEWRGHFPALGRHWAYTEEKMRELERQGLLEHSQNGIPYVRKYLDESPGVPANDIWTDTGHIKSKSFENCNYPTQKPEKLIERLILASSNPGDLIFDCFMGSGTTQAVAMKLGRRFIGADINLGAIQTTTKRLIALATELQQVEQPMLASGSMEIEPGDTEETAEDVKYTGFEVYNVNNYEFFRNPVEARELLIDALEIQPFPQSDVWDGELDGRMVKIMPVNRIATKADLEELKANLPYKNYEKRKEENPNQPVEKITIVCMGHEPDLKASLQAELFEYKLDIEIVDILRDKADLQLKREAEAEIVREGGKLVIRAFYPLNLMQKLSLQKEYVEDWRQLVESIMIDWNYDGVVMQPAVADIPGNKDMVSGIYDIPSDAGTIKVKITDLLSESLEVEVR